MPAANLPIDTAPTSAASGVGCEPIGPGAFIAIVGPSGAGKDTLIRLAKQQLADDAAVRFPRRMVTRGPDANEDHVPITEGEWATVVATGVAAIAWRAHGLGYAVPAEVDDFVRAGGVAVVNVSRKAVDEAKARYCRFALVVVTAPAEVLAERLARRGREDADAVVGRLARAEEDVPEVADTTVISNVGDPMIAAGALVAVIRRLKPNMATLP